MTDETGYGVLTDAQWADLAPLIEQCRPPHKTEHVNLRRTIEAIVWRHDNGAKWRAIPPHLGPWWMAARPSTAGAAMASGSDCWSGRNSVTGSSWAWPSSTAARSAPTRKLLVRP